LDHLLTRMRRNDENLLVLAGADTSRRRPDPVPLSAVVLAAMAEIEEYERVVSDVDDGGYIAGGAVVDVVHILAELLENAASYSPPDSTVLVIGRVAPAGRPGESASSATPVAAATAQMGLWVVGRLAARHGMTVRLRALTSGIQAEISIPAPLLAPAPARSYADLARSVLRSSMTHLLGHDPSAEAGAGPERRAPVGGAGTLAGAPALPPGGAPSAAPAAPARVPVEVPLTERETPAYGSPPLPRPPADDEAISYVARTESVGADPDTANLDGWTRPIRLPSQAGRRTSPDVQRTRRDRQPPNAAPATAAAAPARPGTRSPAAGPTTAAGPTAQPAATRTARSGGVRGSNVPAPADGGTSRAGLPVRVPMAQLP